MRMEWEQRQDGKNSSKLNWKQEKATETDKHKGDASITFDNTRQIQIAAEFVWI